MLHPLSSRRRHRMPFLVALVVAGALAAAVRAAPPAAATVPLGVNLEAVVDYQHSAMFTDLIHQIRPFGSAKLPWDQKATLAPDGWPTGDFGVVFIADVPDSAGTYQLSFDGTATVQGVACPATVTNATVSHGVSSMTVTLAPGATSLFLAFTQTSGHITNIHLIRPNQDPRDTFSQPFLAMLKPFSVLRCMDILRTNGSPVVHWSDRATPTDITQATPRGVAYEYLIQLANQQHKDLWLNIPDQADDDYVTHLAQLLKKTLDPDRKIYLEYSNEVWNSGFPQFFRNAAAATREAAIPGTPLAKDGDRNQWYRAFKRVSERIARISGQFRAVFGDAAMFTRIRPVLASQVATPAILESQLAFMRRFLGTPDTLIYGTAGAPYLSLPGPLNSRNDLTEDQVLAGLQERVKTSMDAHRHYVAIALLNGVKPLCYEGGLDLSGDKSVAARIAVNRDPRITPVVEEYLHHWYAAGGDLFCWFDVCSSYTHYGQWGLTDDPQIQTPKTQAIDAIAAQPRPPLAIVPPLPQTLNAFNDRILGGGGDAEKTPDGTRYLANFRAGGTATYLINVPHDGTYQLVLTTAADHHQGTLSVALDAAAPVATLTTVATGGWQKFHPQTPISLQLTAGLHDLTIAVVAAGYNIQTLTIAEALRP